MELGTIIKRRRHELGMTQNQLADDICTQALISRIENNDIVPKKEILDKIEERLEFNMSELNIVFNLNTTQSKINELISEVREYFAKREYRSIELLMAYNESLIESCKDVNDQAFFKWVEAVVKNELYGHRDEAMALLMDIPDEQLENELRIEIVNAIGLIYYREKDFSTALSFFHDGMQLINDSVDYKAQTKLLFNYALTLEESELDSEALSITLSGIELLVENDSLYLLGDLYYTKGFIFNKLHNYQEAINDFELAQSIFKIQSNTRFYNLSQLALSELYNKMNIKEEQK